MLEHPHNWAENHAYRAAEQRFPETIAQVQELVRTLPRIRALGSRHSFNDIADTDGAQISLKNLARVLSVDPQRRTVTIDGGLRYGDLGPVLHEQGFALHNLASLPHISVAGAAATATHGSGDRNGNLATAVVGMEFVTADGRIVSLSRADNPDTFPGAVVHVGALGIVTGLTLSIEPTFAVRQDVYEDLPFAALTERFDAITSAAYSVSLFTHWRDARIDQVWLKSRTDAAAPPDSLFGATRVPGDRHPIREITAENCTPQGGVPGPWCERLAHFKMGFTPSSGQELQSEYFVPRRHAVDALRAVAALGPALAPHLMVSEVRTIAADDLWLSPACGEPAVGIHFTWEQHVPEVRALLTRIEQALLPFEVRPHWGKLFTLSPETVRAAFPRLPDFQALARRFDPHGRFRNDFLETFVL